MLSQQNEIIEAGAIFRLLFIIESREGWGAAKDAYDPACDLVLTYDFGLKHDIDALGGRAYYLDHLCSQAIMQENNFLMYHFFRDWHFDKNGKDLFNHNGVDFGFGFRIEIWNDFTFYVRTRICLEQLRDIQYQALWVGAGQDLIFEVLQDMGLPFSVLEKVLKTGKPRYFFPIHRWMDERLRIRTWRQVLRDVVVPLQGVAMAWVDSLVGRFLTQDCIFVQEYHPSRALMYALQADPEVKVLQGHFSAKSGFRKFWGERPIPVYGRVSKWIPLADKLMDGWIQSRCARLVLSNGIDITDPSFRLIERRIRSLLPATLRNLDCVIRYLNRFPLKLVVLIGNVGQLAMLVDSVAKNRAVPTYMIINGILSNEYLDEAKYASFINSYSVSIRDNYFKGLDNVVCLGDPRMDCYYDFSPNSRIDRSFTRIAIGASGFNNVDLNSYLSVEYEFLSDVLTAISNVAKQGNEIDVVLKVRPNGYVDDYRVFIEEYFPGVVIRIEDEIPMRTVLEQVDFYISIYSQTLFEASCMGIPCVYHKKDVEIMDPPFDGKSEVVTTTSVPELEQAIIDFLSGSTRFDSFLSKPVMEKYIGPLDGKNLERNISFVKKLIKTSCMESESD